MCWELFPGSSRLTPQADVREMDKLFLIDICHGWDLDTEFHMDILNELYESVLPSGTWAAMPCKYWTQAGHRQHTRFTTINRNAPSARLQFIVWITHQAWDNAFLTCQIIHKRHIYGG